MKRAEKPLLLKFLLKYDQPFANYSPEIKKIYL